MRGNNATKGTFLEYSLRGVWLAASRFVSGRPARRDVQWGQEGGRCMLLGTSSVNVAVRVDSPLQAELKRVSGLLKQVALKHAFHGLVPC